MGAAGENWGSLCPLRDAICPCLRTCRSGAARLPPTPFPSIHPSTPPSVHPLAFPPSRGSAVLNHPGMLLLSSLLFSLHPVTNSSHSPPTFPSNSVCFDSPPPNSHPFLSIFNQSRRRWQNYEMITQCDEPSENKGYCFNCQLMTASYTYQCVSLICGRMKSTMFDIFH